MTQKKRGCIKSTNWCHIELCRNATPIGNQSKLHFDKPDCRQGRLPMTHRLTY